MVATSRRILEKGIMLPDRGFENFLTYESNLPFVLRYMVDKAIMGASWVELSKSTYVIRREAERTSTVQLEVDVEVLYCGSRFAGAKSSR